MWTRARIKEEARNSLRRFGYWMPLLVTFLCGIITGGISTGGGTTNTISAEYRTEYNGELTPSGFVLFLKEFFGEAFGEFGMIIEDFFSNPLIAMTTIFFIVLGIVIGFALAFGWSAFFAGAFTNAIPGIVLQLIIIPILVITLNKLFPQLREDQKDHIEK